jgi:tetratricopeptide (TPR) repeat protein
MIAKRLIRIMVVGAVVLLTGCGGNKAGMLQQLEQLEQQNRSGQPMLNDSLAEDLVSYFDRHGSANERMRSRYILGRTYYCLGELPRALELYNEAADCADTTSADCEFKVLSRIHAQSAVIFNLQIQPRSQLGELRLAERYAWKGKDTIQAIECYSQQGDAYDFLHKPDSVIIIKSKASTMFRVIGQNERSAQTLSSAITALVEKGNIASARKFCNLYETQSGLFDEDDNIVIGREIYYYAKGIVFLAINQLDSAEYIFRKELRYGKDLNNQIAGCKGLQKVYEQRRISDSIAKYATLSYELNDSAYSLSEMQNIQKFQASYDYNHIKYKAEKKELEAQRAWLIVALASILFIVVGMYFGRKYLGLRNMALDHRLRKADITRKLKKLANSNPPQYPTFDDWDQLRAFVEREIPSFRKALKVDALSLTEWDYDICLMIRVHLLPIEIAKLKQCSPSTVTKTRKRLLRLIFGEEGSSDDFDDEIGKIGNDDIGKILSLHLVKSFSSKFFGR